MKMIVMEASGLPVKLSQPALRALEAAGIERLEQLAGRDAREIANLHGMGPKGMRLLREALAGRGWAFCGEEVAVEE